MALFYTRCLQELPKITVTDVHRLAKTSSKAPTSKLEEGFKLYVSSYLFNYEGKCSQVSYQTRQGRLLKAIVLKPSEPVTMTHHCSCVAGTALCNHTVTLLFQSAHYSQTGTPVVPPVHSCTAAEQQWHKPRTMGLKPGPIGKMTITKPTKECMAEGGMRSTLYSALLGPLPDLSVLQIEEAYKNFDPVSKPLICSMGMSAEKLLVDSHFGKIQVGSLLSYQQPPITTRHIVYHKETPPFPSLPLDGYRLESNFQRCTFVLSEEDQLHMESLQVSFATAHKIEGATREQSAVSDWQVLRKPRLTSSRFREACHVRGLISAGNLAERILKGTAPTADMKRGLELKMEAASDYCKMQNVNFSHCGLIIHTDVPWLASSPDGLVYDPLEHPPFGLVEIKNPN
ncbi:unnamed protein product, partial [Coregonus sp. 'balchen']